MIRTKTWRGACAGVLSVRGVLVFGLPAVWLVAATFWELACPFASHGGMAPRFVTCAAFLALVAYLLTSVRLGPVRELRRVREVARAAQQCCCAAAAPARRARRRRGTALREPWRDGRGAICTRPWPPPGACGSSS